MSILELQTVTLLVSLIWFDYFEFQFTLKRWRKIPAHQYTKPYDCFFCTNFWIGVTIAILYTAIYSLAFGFDLLEIRNVATFIGINAVIGNVISHIKYE